MGISAQAVRERLRRWWEQPLGSEVEPETTGVARHHELLAYAMGPELISLAALMALAEDAPPRTGRRPSSAKAPENWP